MQVNWSQDDRVALNVWLNTDLGQKFIRALEHSRPKVKGIDINVLAVAGAMQQGYDTALEQIDLMRQIKGGGLLEPKYINTAED